MAEGSLHKWPVRSARFPEAPVRLATMKTSHKPAWSWGQSPHRSPRWRRSTAPEASGEMVREPPSLAVGRCFISLRCWEACWPTPPNWTVALGYPHHRPLREGYGGLIWCWVKGAWDGPEAAGSRPSRPASQHRPSEVLRLLRHPVPGAAVRMRALCSALPSRGSARRRNQITPAPSGEPAWAKRIRPQAPPS